MGLIWTAFDQSATYSGTDYLNNLLCLCYFQFTQYGEGFLPDQPIADQTRSFLLSVNQSITETKKHVSVAVADRKKKKAKALADTRPHTKVVLEVSTTEVVPLICTTHGHNLATGEKMDPLRRTTETDSSLQFYLVDCRPESIASEQGRFPTAVTLRRVDVNLLPCCNDKLSHHHF